tara:strand:+ start:11421 stop:11651 length:231 start_codon:yes stop_codon:yes gene_type:complete
MSDSFEKKVFEVIASTLKVPVNDLKIDIGAGDIKEWDSLGHTNVILAIEEAFDTTFDIEEALEIETIQDIIEILKE